MNRGPTSVLGEFAAELDFAAIPQDLVRKQVLHLLDGLGNGLYGSSTEFGRAIVRAVQRGRGYPQASVWGTDCGTSVELAAFANASFANVGELEDAHHRTKFKPNTLILPAVLAAAEWAGVSGEDVIAAIVVGTEVGIRVGEALHVGTDAYRRGWLGTGVIGGLATAAAIARILGQSKDVASNAIALGANMPAGIWASGLTPAKRAMIGRAASSGVLAAILADEGITAGPEVLAPSWGSLGDIVGGIFDGGHLTEDLGKVWKSAEVGLEWYPTKGAMHSSLDAVLELASSVEFDPAAITGITIRTAKAIAENPALYRYPPRDLWEAQHNFQYCIAVAALERECTVRQFREELLTDDEVHRLASLVTVVADRDATDKYPKTKTATVHVFYGSRETVSSTVDYCTGEPENFPSEARIREKFRSAAYASVRDNQRLGDIERTAFALPHARTVRDLTALLGGDRVQVT